MSEIDWAEEYKKCKGDPVYYYENYLLIDGKKPPPLTDKQKELMRGKSVMIKTRKGTRLVQKAKLIWDKFQIDEIKKLSDER